MYDAGHQHHHGVRKNLVEGIGGVLIGAAAVLLLTRFLKGGKAARAEAPAPAPESVEQAAPKPAAPKRAASKRAAPAKATTPVAKQPGRARTQTAGKAATKPAAKSANPPESTET